MAKTQITQREKAVLVIGAVSILVMLGTFALRGPLRAYEESKQQVAEARFRLSDAYDLQALIETQKAEAAQIGDVIGAGGVNRDLMLVVNEVLEETGLTLKAEFQEQPSTVREIDVPLDTIRLDLKGVSLDEFINLMHALYARDKLLILERLDYLRPATNEQGIDALMVLSSVNA